MNEPRWYEGNDRDMDAWDEPDEEREERDELDEIDDEPVCGRFEPW